MNGAGHILWWLSLAIVVGAVLAYPMMLLWNGCLVPAIPGLKEVSFLQMWGLSILSNYLFKTNVKTS